MKIENWKDNYDTETLNQAINLYNNDHVINYISSKNFATAYVYDGRKNQVVIQKNNEQLIASCDCGKERCAHEAAVLLRYEKEEKASKINTITYIDPFRHSATNYYSISRITRNIRISKKMVAEARALIDEYHLKLNSVYEEYLYQFLNNDKRVIHFIMELEDKNKIVELCIDKDNIISSRCMSCFNHYNNRYEYNSHISLCPHILALMLLADEYLYRYNPGDDTTKEGDAFINSFSSINLNKREEVLHLIPYIKSENKDLLTLNLKLGIDKKLQVKNISKLIEAEEERKVLTLGKNEFDFENYTFVEEDIKLYNFIKKRFDEMKSLLLYGERSTIPNAYIELRGANLDAFYDFMHGEKLANKDNDDYLIGDDTIRIEININAEINEDKIKGIDISSNNFTLLKGAKYYYISNSKGLRKLNLFDGDIAASLYTNKRIYIGEKNLSELFNRLLPKLEDSDVFVIYKNFKEDEVALPIKAKFSFYVDLDDDEVFCKCSVDYNEHHEIIRRLKEEDFPLASYRDIKNEDRIIEKLEDLFPYYRNEDDSFSTLNTPDNIYSLLKEGLQELKEYGEVNISKKLKNINFYKSPTLALKVNSDHDLLDLSITSDLPKEELLSLLKSYKEKKRYYRLPNGDYYELKNNKEYDFLFGLLERDKTSLKELIEGNMHLPLYRAFYLDKCLENQPDIKAIKSESFNTLVETFKNVKDKDYALPMSLENTLKPYQKEAFKFEKALAEMGLGGILADEMGLGKTLEIIAYLLSEKEEKEIKVLLVTPASLLYNWQEEIKRFAPIIKTTIITGSQEERKILLNEKADIYITSYDLLKRDILNYHDLHFTHQIIDEAQYIKNAKATVSKAVKVIDAKIKFALTGTPIENRLSELWSIFDYVLPGYLGNYEYFKNHYESAILKEDKETKEELKMLISPFIKRRKKSEVLKELPLKIEEYRYAHFKDDQQKLYDAEVVKIKKMINSDDASKEKIKILAELTKIREICCDPKLLFDNYLGESAKKEVCLDLIDSAIAGGHKILLFSQFTSMLELLEIELKQRDIKYYKITGATKKEDRLELVKTFNNDDTPLFLISLKAGGTGLNLVGADVVIHYDPWWNLAAENQAIDRAHRIGQKRNVNVYRLIVQNTIEEKIVKMQKYKKEMADTMLEETGTSLSTLSEKELIALFS